MAKKRFFLLKSFCFHYLASEFSSSIVWEKEQGKVTQPLAKSIFFSLSPSFISCLTTSFIDIFKEDKTGTFEKKKSPKFLGSTTY